MLNPYPPVLAPNTSSTTGKHFIWKVPFDSSFIIWTSLASQSDAQTDGAWHWPRFTPWRSLPPLPSTTEQLGWHSRFWTPQTSLRWESGANEGPAELAHRTSSGDASVWNSLQGGTPGTRMSVLDCRRGEVCSFPPPSLLLWKRRN